MMFIKPQLSSGERIPLQLSAQDRFYLYPDTGLSDERGKRLDAIQTKWTE